MFHTPKLQHYLSAQAIKCTRSVSFQALSRGYTQRHGSVNCKENATILLNSSLRMALSYTSFSAEAPHTMQHKSSAPSAIGAWLVQSPYHQKNKCLISMEEQQRQLFKWVLWNRGSPDPDGSLCATSSNTYCHEVETTNFFKSFTFHLILFQLPTIVITHGTHICFVNHSSKMIKSWYTLKMVGVIACLVVVVYGRFFAFSYR